MKRIMYLFMLSCKKATALMEKRSLIKLSFIEKVQLGLHKNMCDACTAYEKQSKKIDELLFRHIHNTNIENTVDIKNESLKEKIINNITKS